MDETEDTQISSNKSIVSSMQVQVEQIGQNEKARPLNRQASMILTHSILAVCFDVEFLCDVAKITHLHYRKKIL